MNEQQTEHSGDDSGSGFGSCGAGSADPQSAGPRIDRLMASGQAAHSGDASDIGPNRDEAANTDKALEFAAEAAKAAMPKAEPFMVQGVQVDAAHADTAKTSDKTSDTAKTSDKAKTSDTVKTDNGKPDAANTNSVKAGTAHPPRELLIMAPGARGWTRGEDQVESGHPAPKLELEGPRGRRVVAMAAMLVLAVIAGAAGGAFATVALSHPTEPAAAATSGLAALETSVGRIDADITALKAGVDRTNAGLSQVNKTGDRLERIEKAQAEAAAKFAKLGEAVDKLRAAGLAAAPPVATVTPKDITGTVTTSTAVQALPTPQLHAAPATNSTTTTAGNPPTTEVGRLPTVEGWVLRDAGRGSALIEGRSGLYEVFAGDPVPGLGRVDAIRKQDGRWVVVTTKGLIVAR